MGGGNVCLRWQTLIVEQREASSFQTDLLLNLPTLVEKEKNLSSHSYERSWSLSCPTGGSPGGTCPGCADTSLVPLLEN